MVYSFVAVAFALLDVMLLMGIADVITWKHGIALLGLCWDFLGAVLFGAALLWRRMASLNAFKEVMKSEHRMPPRSDATALWPVMIAFLVGPKLRNSTDTVVDEDATEFGRRPGATDQLPSRRI